MELADGRISVPTIARPAAFIRSRNARTPAPLPCVVVPHPTQSVRGVIREGGRGNKSPGGQVGFPCVPWFPWPISPAPVPIANFPRRFPWLISRAGFGHALRQALQRSRQIGRGDTRQQFPQHLRLGVGALPSQRQQHVQSRRPARLHEARQLDVVAQGVNWSSPCSVDR